MARIEKQDNKDKIIVSKLRKTRENKEDKQFKNRVKALMPKIDLPDLLLEVNQQLDLTSCFHHINESNTRMDHLDISVLAVLLAEACNIGFSPVSKEGIESLKYDRLMYVNHQYVRLDTLSATNKKIISAYKKLPISLVWEIIKWLRPTVFVIPHHNVPYILEVIQNILAAVVESHFTSLFLINILAFMEWLFQEHCVILCTYWMVF